MESKTRNVRSGFQGKHRPNIVMNLVAICFLFFFSPLSAQPQNTLAALLACDTESDLGNPIKKDLANIRILMREISRYTGIQVKTAELSDANLSIESVQKWVADVNESHPDVVLFYFSGHGYRTASTLEPWPILFFSKPDEDLDSLTLWNNLKDLKPRLLIVLLDCCNRRSTFADLGLRQAAKNLVWETKRHPGFKTLFLRTQGTILAIGAAPGEAAYALENGSLFTASLTQTMRSSTTAKKTSWNAILAHTASLCSRLQHPASFIQTSEWIPAKSLSSTGRKKAKPAS